MIVVTGASGFIGSCLIHKLNREGIEKLILVDEFSRADKNKNLEDKSFTIKMHRDIFIEWFKLNASDIEFVFHIGAKTDTTEMDKEIFDRLNVNYSKNLWQICSQYQIPMVYASSAATYGIGDLGYDDKHNIVTKLRPLNPYGLSKNNFDIWALEQDNAPPFWTGLKFFNVYGPNEYHKGRMASVIFHAFHQIEASGGMKLFRSHHPDFKDGEQKRDFVYVKDVINVCFFLYKNQKHSGLYNIGTGNARTFLDLTKNTFKAMDKEVSIQFIDTPIDIRDKYQYFTEANMSKLRSIGYDIPFYSLEEGVKDYVQNYLLPNNYL